MMNNYSPIEIIYVAGSSYSGTTILGLVLSTSEKVFNAGEVCKYNEIKDQSFKIDPQKEVDNICTCGKIYNKCPYWGRIYSSYQKDIDFNPAGFSKENFKLMLKLLNPFSRLKPDNMVMHEYVKYSKLLFHEAQKLNPSVKYLLDVSKSIYNINLLKHAPEVNLKVIHLVRDPMDTCNSFKKHRIGFLYAICSWIMVNLFIKRFIKRTKAESITIEYEDMCKNTNEVFTKINHFLDINIDGSSYVEQVNKRDFHIVTGNPFLNDFSFKGLEIQPAHNRLNWFEQKLVKLFASPLIRCFLKDKP